MLQPDFSPDPVPLTWISASVSALPCHYRCTWQAGPWLALVTAASLLCSLLLRHCGIAPLSARALPCQCSYHLWLLARLSLQSTQGLLLIDTDSDCASNLTRPFPFILLNKHAKYRVAVLCLYSVTFLISRK